MFLADKWATRIFLGRLEFFSGNLTWHLNIFLRTTPEISTDLDELIRKNDSVSKFLRSSEILNCTQQNLRSCMGNLVVKNFQTHRLRNFENLPGTKATQQVLWILRQQVAVSRRFLVEGEGNFGRKLMNCPIISHRQVWNGKSLWEQWSLINTNCTLNTAKFKEL